MGNSSTVHLMLFPAFHCRQSMAQDNWPDVSPQTKGACLFDKPGKSEVNIEL
ncbi:hypothetical protein BgiBS90_015461, partial [Biomphalaria glabrata]